MNIRPIDANALVEKLDNINPVDYGAMSSYETHNGARDALSDAVMHVNDAPTLSLNTLRDEIYEDAVAHGLWEDIDKLCKELADEGDEQQRKDDELYHRRVSATKAVFYESDELLTAAEENNSSWQCRRQDIWASTSTRLCAGRWRSTRDVLGSTGRSKHMKWLCLVAYFTGAILAYMYFSEDKFLLTMLWLLIASIGGVSFVLM